MFSTRSTRFSAAVLALAFSLVVLAGCGGDEPPEQTAESGETPQMIQREAPKRTPAAEPEPEDAANDFNVVPRVEGELEHDGMGLDTIIDASSKKAFADSLRWIAQDVSPEQYDRLEQSLRYIKAYDASVLGSEEKFLETIDGKTGQELIDRSNKLIKERY